MPGKMNNAMHRINHYPVDSAVCSVNSYPLDSDLPGNNRALLSISIWLSILLKTYKIQKAKELKLYLC